MAQLVKSWNDGGSLSVTYDGDGDGSVIFASDVAEGLDREMLIVFRDVGKTVAVEKKVLQVGMREMFVPNDGEFVLSEGGSFNVLKPDKPYTEIEYIESTGTQYINTGMLSTNKSHVDVVFGFSSMESGAANNAAVFGGRDAQVTNTFTLFKLASTNPQAFRFDYNRQVTVGSANDLTWDVSSKYRFIYNGALYETSNITTGEVVSGNISASSTYTTSPICLFAVNTNGTIGTYMKGRIYRFTYTDGTTKIDLIPVKDKNNVVCMYDRVSKQYFYNQGTGEFIAGSNVKGYDALEYVESNGTQWIDTGYTIDTSTDSVEFVFQNIGTTIYKWLMGEHDNNARFGLGTGDGTAKRNVAYGATTYKVKDAQIFDTQHTFIANENGVFLDGTKVANFSSFASSSSIYLFNLNLNNTDYCGAAKVWGYKHYRNGSLIRDLIPVLDKDNIVCMYDNVSGQFFYNQGTGNFIAGNKI